MDSRLIAKAYLLSLKHFKLFWWEADEICLSKARTSILVFFARHVLMVDSDINKPEKIQNAASRYL